MANRATVLLEEPARTSTPPPTAGRLAQLVDAAERRRLTPVEAAELRRGVEHLKACLAGAGAQLRRQIDEAERARDDHARDLLMVHHPAMGVECRRCGAAAGTWCRPVVGLAMPRTLHVARLVDAGALS
ncbi:hypothetical protein [Kitasatospora sp. NPDC086791]|uniref:zinc finger domain-containing protein n=1 Tax=Kitasatospora sp. NPDC086791 TaxID=3155178 RepID=UPI003430BB05